MEEQLREETNRVIVPPSADPRVLAGAGTVALEPHEQAQELGVSPDAVLVPCGGGGLTASTAAVLSGKIEIKDRVLAAIVTGGNVDATRFCALLNDKAAA